MPDAQGQLTKSELEAILAHLYGRAEDALQTNTREALREVLEEISDICHPDSILEVDVKAESVVSVTWPSEDDDDDIEIEIGVADDDEEEE